MKLVIRPLKSAEDGQHLEQIIMNAWGSNDADAIPGHLSLTVAKENGGVILLAFDADENNRPIGFCWGFWAYVESKKRWKCASHMAGVIQDYKGKGIGEQIKWAQRKFVLGRGFDWMTWTYDPLETLNGSLNIRKLGAVCNTYYENLYGDLNDGLNKGIPTDRFGVDWWLGSDWVEAHEDGSRRLPTLSAVLEAGGQRLNDITTSGTHKNRLMLPAEKGAEELKTLFGQSPAELVLTVPRRFQAVKKIDLQAGVAWRMHTRELFQIAFANRYTVTDLIPDPNQTTCHYLLHK